MREKGWGQTEFGYEEEEHDDNGGGECDDTAGEGSAVEILIDLGGSSLPLTPSHSLSPPLSYVCDPPDPPELDSPRDDVGGANPQVEAIDRGPDQTQRESLGFLKRRRFGIRVETVMSMWRGMWRLVLMYCDDLKRRLMGEEVSKVLG
ncbi:endoplasmic reticulum vesicle transporter protein [Actinidia rufa]|uniref:Endoplasmic reticulum vesicle transporter protein n=1 Tax=Actinidia rufa TaxID=165716 RepID=A0A7J0GGX9_9ERIC|nr:endoplasmic reticulum vesicle transporter protein [Actinidia rufa]